MIKIRYHLLGLAIALATLGSGHAAPMSDALVKQLLPGKTRCDDARNDAIYRKMNVDFDEYCTCHPKKAEVLLRAADWQSPENPTAADKDKYRDLLTEAEVACMKPYVKKYTAQQLLEMCRAGRGIFDQLAKQGPAALEKGCPCIATKATEQTYGVGDSPINPNTDTKAALAAAIASCKQ